MNFNRKKPRFDFDAIGPWSVFSLWEVAFRYYHDELSEISISDIAELYKESFEEIICIATIYDLEVGYSKSFLEMYINEY